MKFIPLFLTKRTSFGFPVGGHVPSGEGYLLVTFVVFKRSGTEKNMLRAPAYSRKTALRFTHQTPIWR